MRHVEGVHGQRGPGTRETQRGPRETLGVTHRSGPLDGPSRGLPCRLELTRDPLGAAERQQQLDLLDRVEHLDAGVEGAPQRAGGDVEREPGRRVVGGLPAV